MYIKRKGNQMLTRRSNQTDDDYLWNHTVQPLLFQSYGKLRNKSSAQIYSIFISIIFETVKYHWGEKKK